ncbi:MAG: head fiber protein [Peptostreptococcaceae bacterium]
MRVDNYILMNNARLRIFMTLSELMSDDRLEIGTPCMTIGLDYIGDGGGKFYHVEHVDTPNNIIVPDKNVSLREFGGFGGGGGSVSGMVSAWAGVIEAGESIIETGITSMTNNPAVFVGGHRMVKAVDFELDQVNIGNIILKHTYVSTTPVYVEDIPGFKTWFGVLRKGQAILNTGLKDFTPYTQIYANGLKIAEHVDYDFDATRGLLSLYTPYEEDVIICIDDMVKTSAHINIATTDSLGVVRVGQGLSIDTKGVLTALPQDFLIPSATNNILGAVIVGDNIHVDANGRISVAKPYELPMATSSSLGGIMIGNGLSIVDGKLMTDVVNDATHTDKGIVKIGFGLDVSGGLVSTKKATGDNHGVIKGGDNVILNDGTLSVPISGSSYGVVKTGTNINNTNGVISIPLATKTTNGVIKVGEGLSVTDGVVGIDINAVPSKTYIDTKIAELIGSAPEYLNTLEELATAIESSGDVISGLVEQVGGKLGKTEIAFDSNMLGGLTKDALVLETRNGLVNHSVYDVHIDTLSSNSNDGHMSKEDKVKLDGVDVNANNYILPTATNSVLGGVKIGQHIQINNGVISVAAPYVHPNDVNTRHVSDIQISVWNEKAPGGYGLGTPCTQVSNLALDTGTGFYMGSNVENGIEGGHNWKYYLVMKHNNMYSAMLGVDFTGEKIAFRTKMGGSLNPWVELYHAGNLGLATSESSGLMSKEDKVAFETLKLQFAELKGELALLKKDMLNR